MTHQPPRTWFVRPQALALLALMALLATLIPLSVAPPVDAAPACPADKSHLVPWKGGRWFLSGANVPWQNGGFGADFGTVEAWGQHTYSSATTDRMFAELRASGSNSVRWWVFADGRGAPEFSNGFTTGFDTNTLPKMADAIKLAEKHNIYLTFTLWSFDMLFAGDGPTGGKRDLIVDTARRKSLIDNALIPMLRYSVPGTNYTIGTHPNVISWEIINEPEWGIRESGSVHGNIREPVSLAEMQRFIAETTGAIHRNSNQLVTVGAAAMKWNSATAPGAVGNWYSDAALKQYDQQGALDYYQVHYYAWTNGDANWSFSPMRVSWQQGSFDKPVVVGEFPANGSGSGMTVHQMLESIFGHCYAGAWSWGYHRVDSNGGWSDTAPGMAQFNSAHRAEVAIGGSASPAPTSPPAPTNVPLPPTSSPPQPTAAPPAPTATPPPTTGAETVIYADALAPGWANWSWGSTVTLNSGTVVREGARAIQVTHLAPWAALRLHTERPLPTAGRNTLRFWLHGGATGGQALQLYIETGSAMSPQVRLPTPEANRWTLVEVPLARLGSPAQITDLAIQEAGGVTGRPFFVDQLSLVAAGAAPQPAPANGQQIYDDALVQGWQNWSWGVSVRLDDRTRVQSGERAIAATFQHAWAGLKLHHQSGVATAGSSKIRLWLHGGERGGQQLQVYVLNGNGWTSPMARLPALPANRWTLLEVPLTQLGSPARITDLILHERGGLSRDTVYVDDIQLTP